MTDKNILVIDDSATIRKLVDSHLSSNGYHVTLAPNAEDGLALADEIRPDLILLDHQLPGTTGFEVAQELASSSELAQIPVVISSTLRKKAYVEYADLDNVVDMLPKPYTEDLLVTTVANAIETAAMVVASQSKGSAVPEVIDQQGEADLSGTFANMKLREVIDFLNNGSKQGVLELEAERLRLWIYMKDGRIQGVSSSGLSAEDIERVSTRLPESLTNLAEVLKLTIAGRGSSEFDSFLKLLDRRVLDPRLTAKLMRFQASMLMGIAQQRQLIAFQFRSTADMPGLHQNLPLDISLLALLVEHSLHCDESELPEEAENQVYVRRTIRGQNLDRSGLSARHMKVLNLLSEPASIDDLSSRLDWERDEIRRVLNAFVNADILERKQDQQLGKFVVFESNTVIASKLRAALKEQNDQFIGKVVRDPLTLQLLVKRSSPDTIFFAIDAPTACRPIHDAYMANAEAFADSRKVVLVPQRAVDDSSIDWHKLLGFAPDQILPSPYSPESLLQYLSDPQDQPQAASADEPAAEPVAASPAPSLLSTMSISNEEVTS